MMEIKFRAKRIDSGEWVEGFYCNRKTGHYTDIRFVEECKDCIIKEFSDGGISWCDIDPETLCQYTGLKDKNGAEIYEGDIIRYRLFNLIERNLKVFWDNERYCFSVMDLANGEKTYLFKINILCYEIELIGNIWDNSELLETVK